MVSIFCDYCETECFNFNECDQCLRRINAAAYDLLDYFNYTSDQFQRETLSGFNDFIKSHRSEIYNRMVEIENERFEDERSTSDVLIF